MARKSENVVYTSEDVVPVGGNLYAAERQVDHYVAGTPSRIPGTNTYYINTVNADSGAATGDWATYFPLGDTFTATGFARKAGPFQVNGFESIHDAMLYANKALGFEVVREPRLP